MKPSIETAKKLAQFLEVSLDWLTGQTDLELDRKMVQRIQEVSKMNEKNKEHVIAMLDAFIRETKLEGVLQ